MKRYHYFLLTTFLILSTAAWAQPPEKLDLEPYRAASQEKWEKDMLAFDKRNAMEAHPEDSVLFCGSSSIRLWKTLEEDVAPFHPIHRGFGGSKWSDVAVFAERLIHPHAFRGVVFFVANDIKGSEKEKDKTPEEIVALVSYVREVVRKHNPAAHVWIIAVTPTEKRWHVWEKTQAANEAIRIWTENDGKTHFISTEKVFLGEDGKPLTEQYFVDDQLHLNRGGYRLWSRLVTSALKKELRK